MEAVELIKYVVEKIDRYSKMDTESQGLSFDGLVAFMRQTELEELVNNHVDMERARELRQSPDMPQIPMDIDRVIAQHLLFMYRYVKHYSRKVFRDSSVKTLEEFSYLATLLQYQALTKAELIKKNVHEKSAGIEIIRRLVKLELVTQQENPDDQRSQLVAITPAGRQELFRLFSSMDVLGRVAAGPLSEAEKTQLAFLLKKLDDFHFYNYLHRRDEELHQLTARSPMPHNMPGTGVWPL